MPAAGGNQIQFGVGFNVDKGSLQSLQKDLMALSKMTTKEYLDIHKGMNVKEAEKELLELRKNVTKLSNTLNSAFNKDLGALNIAKLNQSLDAKAINTYAQSLSKMGAQGQQAFTKFSSEILTSNRLLKESHSTLDKMGQTLANSIKWTISSSLINNFTGSIQKAYGYVKQLDEDLNNIRIVTGQSAEQMEEFAKKANAAAQALGSTTTAYAEASLIYYQQGLSGNEVTERTNTTIKMANVLGESAEKVSSYMTAIWNNFDDGSQSLEHYGDVITALGASTASSSEEIASGVEKFASVAETAGLSYEYATSALATVVATTRQSADTVGTSLKTIFSRIQGLKLGETLEDGTDLNKYSEALMKVGINIKDQQGELKDMDDILDEMGAKWQTLAKDQQIALAQAVAGTRQYNQMIALMDNWDFMTKNIETASKATGTLSKQQDIYMDSMEAHLKSLKSAQQNLYDSMFDSDSFKSLIDVFTGLTNGMAGFIDSIGGGGNALLALGGIATNVFSKQITDGIATAMINSANAKYNIEQYNAEVEMTNKLEQAGINSQMVDLPKLAGYKKDILEVDKFLTEEQRNQFNEELKEIALLQQENKEWEIKAEEAKKYFNSFNESNLKDINFLDGAMDTTAATDKLDKQLKMYELIGSVVNRSAEEVKAFNEQNEQTKSEKLDELKSKFDVVSNVIKNTKNITEEERQELTEMAEAYKTALESGDPSKILDVNKNLQASLEGLKDKSIELKNSVTQMADGGSRSMNNLNIATKRFEEELERLHQLSTVDNLVKGLGGLAQTMSGLRSLWNLPNIWQNQDLSMGEKLVQTISALSMGLGMITMGLPKVNAMMLILSKRMTEVDLKAKIASFSFKGLKDSLIKAGASAKANILSFFGLGEAGVESGTSTAAAWATVLIPLLAVTAAIAAAVIVCKIAIDNYNEEINKAKDASAAAEELASRYEDAKTSAENLRNAINGYDSAIATMQDLTKGTEEYNEALKQANESARQLIENSNGVLQYKKDYWYEDGQIKFADGAKEKTMDAANQKEANALSASLIANANAKKANVDAQQISLAQQNDSDLSNGETWVAAGGGLAGAASGAAIGAGVGAALGTVVPVIGNAIGAAGGAIIGGIIGGVGGLISGFTATADAFNEREADRMEALADRYEEIGDLAFEKEELEDLGFEDTSEEYIASLKEVTQANIEARDAQLAAARQAAENVFSQDQDYNKASDQTKQAMGEVGEDIYNDLQKKYYDEFYELAGNWDGWGDSDNEEAFEAATGLSADHVTDFLAGGGVEYIDVNGETKKLSRDMIASMAAANKANEELAKKTDQLVIAFSKLEKSADKNKNVVGAILGGNVDKTNIGDLQSWYDDVSKYKSMNDWIIQEFGDGNEETARKKAEELGYDSIEDFAKDLRPVYKEIKNGLLTNLPSGISESVSKAVKEGDYSSMTTGVRDKVAESLQDAYEASGDAGVEKINSIYKKFNDSGELQYFIEDIEGLDWKSESLGEFSIRMKEMGLATNLTSEEITDLYYNLSQKSAFNDFKENFQNALSTAEGLKTGDTIEEKDYISYYERYGEAIGKYFTTMEDGTKKLTGDAQEFLHTVKGLLYNTINQNIAESKAQLEQKAAEYRQLNVSNDSIYSETMNEYVGAGGSSARMTVNETYKQVQDLLGKLDYTDYSENEKGEQKNKYDEIDAYVKEHDYQYDEANAQLISFGISTEDLNTYREINKLGGPDIEAATNYDKALEAAAKRVQERDEAMEANWAEQQELAKEIMAQETALAQSADSIKDLDMTKLDKRSDAYQTRAMQIHDQERLGDSDIDQEADEEYINYLQELVKTNKEATLGNQELDDSLADNYEATHEISTQVARLNNGTQDLCDNWDDWSKTLKKSSKGSQEYAEIMGDTKEALSDLFDVSQDYISNDFVESLTNDADAMALMEKAAQGDADAIDKLKEKLSEQMLLDIVVENGADVAGVQSKAEELQSLLDAQDLKVGATIEFNNDSANPLGGVAAEQQEEIDKILKGAQELVDVAKMTKDQANEYFHSIGYDVEFETEFKPIKKKGYTTITETTVVPGSESELTAYEMPNSDGTTSPVKVTTNKMETKTYPGSEYEYTDYQEMIAMSTDGTKPKIKGMTKLANSSSVKKPTPKSSSGGSKGSSNKSQKRQKDPYHKVNTQLDNTSKALDKINKKQELQLETSNKYLQSLRDQNTQYNKQISLAKEKIKIAKKELETGRKDNKVYSLAKDYGAKENIIKLAKKLGIKVKNSDFDEYGNLLTSEDVLQKGFEKTKKLDDENKKKKIYDALQTEITRASTAASEKTSAEDAKREAQLLLQQNKANALTIRFQSKIDEQSFTREWNDFKKTTIKRLREDNPLDLSEIISIDRDNLNSRFEDIKTATDRVNSLLSINKNDKKSNYWVKEQGFNEAQYAEDLEAAYEELKAAMTDAEDLQKTITEASITARQNLNEGYNNLYSAYDKLNEYYEHQKTMTTLLYGDKAYGRMTKYYASLTANEWKRTADMYEQVKESIKAFNNYNTEENIKNNDKMLAHTKQTMLDNISAFEGQLQTLVETIKSEFENSVNNIVQTALDGFAHLGGNATFDRLKRNWEIVSDTAEKYLDEKNKEFAMKDLSFAFDDAIKNADTLHAQQRLTDLMNEQLSIAEQKDKLAQKEVDTIQKMLDLEIKRIALEEAQENKTNIRLRRDANGNYSYQFVANENEVNKAQEEYNKANNELYNDLKDNMNNYGNSFADNYQEYIDEVASILADDSLDEFAKQSELTGIKNMFESRLKIDGDNFKSYVDRMRKYLEEEGMSQSEIDEYFEKNFPNFKSMMNIINTGVNLDDTISEAKKAIAQYYQQLGLLQNEYTEEEFQEALKNNLNYESQMLGLLKEEVKSVDNIALLVKAILEGKTWSAAKEGAEETFKELKDLKSLDTGGYTGAWGVDGRVALLHEKELVLNQQDTSNILAAVSVVRNIGSGAFDGIANTIRSIKASVFGANDKNLQQSVQITAEFPNVSNSAEIENALNSLVNKASQFAWSDDLKI